MSQKFSISASGAGLALLSLWHRRSSAKIDIAVAAGRRFILTIAVWSLVCIAGCGEKQAGPKGPTFSIRDVASPAEIKGKNYELAPTVTVVDHRYVFEIRSEYGDIPAVGRNMLQLRLHEMKAIERARRMDKEFQLGKGVADGVQSTAQGFRLLVTDPVGTIRNTPAGFQRMVKDKFDSGTRQGAGMIQREIASVIGCDPDTRNPVLKELLEKMTIQRRVGGTPLSLIPYTGGFRVTSRINEEMRSTPPRVINEKIEKELIASGIDEYLSKKFTRENHFTTLQRMLFMEEFRKLGRLPGREQLLHVAVELNSEAEALTALEIARIMVEYHARQPFRRIDYMGLPIGVMDGGSHQLFHSVDYVLPTPAMQEGVRAYREAYPEVETHLIISGTVSDDAKVILDEARISVREGVR